MIDVSDLVGKPFTAKLEEAFGPHAYNCYGLVWEVFKRFGIDIPKTNVSVTACKEEIEREFNRHASKYWRKIKKAEAPCVVLIKSTISRFANHTGVYIGNNRMLHITVNRNVCVDRLRDWDRMTLGYYKYAGNC